VCHDENLVKGIASAAPNLSTLDLWCIGGHDKLVPWGVHIDAAVDAEALVKEERISTATWTPTCPISVIPLMAGSDWEANWTGGMRWSKLGREDELVEANWAGGKCLGIIPI